MMRLICLLVFMLPLQAATYYVSVADGNDTNCTGLSATPYTSGGPGLGCPWKTLAKANGTSFTAGDIVLLKGGEAWATEQIKPKTAGSEGNPITYGAYNKTAGPPTVGSPTTNSGVAFLANGKSYITLEGLRLEGEASALTGESSLHFQNIIIENAMNTGNPYCFYGAGTQTDILFDHVVLARSWHENIKAGAATITIRNAIILPSAVPYTPWSVTGGSVSVDYSIILTAGTPAAYTDGGHNQFWIDPKVTALPIPTPTQASPRFVFTFDDVTSIDAFSTLMTALEPYGVKATMNFNPGLATAGNITTAQTLSAAGYEIANHGLNHQALTTGTGMTITSTNTSPTVDVDVPTTTITLNCTEVGNRVTLNWSSGAKVSDLISAVSGKGWTISQTSPNAQPSLLIDEFADSNGPQATPYAAQLDTSAPNYKFWAHEISDSQDQIQTITGIRPTTIAYPDGLTNAGLLSWVAANGPGLGLVAARGGSPLPTMLFSVTRWNQQIDQYWALTDSEATVRAWARRLYFWALFGPGYYISFDHAPTAPQQQRFVWFADELSKLGATFNTYGQLTSWINSNHTFDGTNWLATYTATNGDYRLQKGSPAIAAGTATISTDILGQPYRTNDIGVYAYQGSGANALMFAIP